MAYVIAVRVGVVELSIKNIYFFTGTNNMAYAQCTNTDWDSVKKFESKGEAKFWIEALRDQVEKLFDTTVEIVDESEVEEYKQNGTTHYRLKTIGGID